MRSSSELAVTMTPDGGRIVSSTGPKLKVWNLKTGAELYTLSGHSNLNNWIRGVAVAPDGSRAVSFAGDYELKVWDLRTGLIIASFTGDSRFLFCTILSDSRTIIAGEKSGRIHFLIMEMI